MKKVISAILAAGALLMVASCASTPAAPAAEEEEFPAINNPDPEGEVTLLDGWEDGNYFNAIAGAWGNDDTSLSVEESTKWSSEGDTAGLFELNSTNADRGATGGDKASFSCNSLEIVDWTEYTKLYVDVNNLTDSTLDFCFVVQDANWAWLQTDPQTLGKGVNKNVIVDLTAMNIPAPEQINCIFFCIFNSEGGEFMVDNIRLVK